MTVEYVIHITKDYDQFSFSKIIYLWLECEKNVNHGRLRTRADLMAIRDADH